MEFTIHSDSGMSNVLCATESDDDFLNNTPSNTNHSRSTSSTSTDEVPKNLLLSAGLDALTDVSRR